MLLPLSLSLAASGCTSCGPQAQQGGFDEARQLRKRYIELRRMEQALTAEYSLAREPPLYLMVDLRGRQVELRARGRSLRSFGIMDMGGTAGNDPQSQVWTMTDRKPLVGIERPKIVPGAGEEAAAEAAKRALWGPDRMPADFDLICEGGNVLRVRALPAERSHTRIRRWVLSAYRRSADWFRRWGASSGSLPRQSIQLWLSEDDSRLLFWSLPKSISILVLPEGGAASARSKNAD